MPVSEMPLGPDLWPGSESGRQAGAPRGGGLHCRALLYWLDRTLNRATRVGFPIEQPVPFSHKHHVAGLGIDCRFCHATVEVSATAGMPPTHTCMTCHSQLWTNADVLAPVRESLMAGKPLHWVRVNRLPDYVYFNHSIHIAKGIGCVTCHGRIDTMPLTAKAASLRMGWCVDCHRDPRPNLRPRQAIFDMGWRPPADTPSGDALFKQYRLHSATELTDCSVCHR
jgi:hypothetical protein